MAISNIDKEHLNKLITIPNLNELDAHKVVTAIQKNSNNYSKLKLLFKQMENLKNDINEIINESLEADALNDIKCNFKKKPGNTYYLYKKPCDSLFFSILSPQEWTNTKNIFVNAYFYDYDLTFQKFSDEC